MLGRDRIRKAVGVSGGNAGFTRVTKEGDTQLDYAGMTEHC